MFKTLTFALLQVAAVCTGLPASNTSVTEPNPAMAQVGGNSGWTGDIAQVGGNSGWTGDIAQLGGNSGWTGDIA
ncbi:MAG: hypothetical protein M3Y54_01485 [Bacteroidota bacterium]|nr:hypothetical protein [Bacteroidota bacterium]